MPAGLMKRLLHLRPDARVAFTIFGQPVFLYLKHKADTLNI